jgi:hypothetical protein
MAMTTKDEGEGGVRPKSSGEGKDANGGRLVVPPGRTLSAEESVIANQLRSPTMMPSSLACRRLRMIQRPPSSSVARHPLAPAQKPLRIRQQALTLRGDRWLAVADSQLGRHADASLGLQRMFGSSMATLRAGQMNK